MKGLKFESMKGRETDMAIDEQNGYGYIRFNLNGEPRLSSTGVTYVCATGYEKISYKDAQYSVRVNFLQIRNKAALQDETARLRAELAALKAQQNK